MERAPSRVVAVADAAAVMPGLDQGRGTVWAGDARDGFHGGATRTLPVWDAESAAAATAFFSTRADRVRVMPLLDGLPCSIHGWVFPDGVAALRPMEMVVFRRARDFFYAGSASWWDPAPEDREAMREVARRVGIHLRDTCGYRGTFSVDGVLTADGFRPTELNPRFGAAIMAMTRPLGIGTLLSWLNSALVEGVPPGIGAEEFEARLLPAVDAARGGGGSVTTPVPRVEPARVELVDDGGWRLAREGEAPHARLVAGPGAAGTYASVELLPEHTPVGPPVAPRVAAVLRLLDPILELGIGELRACEPAR